MTFYEAVVIAAMIGNYGHDWHVERLYMGDYPGTYYVRGVYGPGMAFYTMCEYLPHQLVGDLDELERRVREDGQAGLEVKQP